MQGQLWTEYIATPSLLEYMAFPRTCALAEIAWSRKDRPAFGDFLNRLRTHLRRLDVQDGLLTRVRRLLLAREFARRTRIPGTPSLVINGQYLVKGNSAEDQLRIASALIAQARSGKAR